VALWGRRGSTVSGPGWALRPERVKEGLFATAAHAGALTGRFRIASDGERPVLHVQLRDGAGAGPGIAAALRAVASTAAGVTARVEVHEYREYPFHEAGDFQHKPAYVERTR
jgi:phenylacetate-CoA ligase